MKWWGLPSLQPFQMFLFRCLIARPPAATKIFAVGIVFAEQCYTFRDKFWQYNPPEVLGIKAKWVQCPVIFPWQPTPSPQDSHLSWHPPSNFIWDCGVTTRQVGAKRRYTRCHVLNHGQCRPKDSIHCRACLTTRHPRYIRSCITLRTRRRKTFF